MLDETIVVENMGMPAGHLNKVSILKNQKVMANLRFIIWRPCWFLKSLLMKMWE